MIFAWNEKSRTLKCIKEKEIIEVFENWIYNVYLVIIKDFPAGPAFVVVWHIV